MDVLDILNNFDGKSGLESKGRGLLVPGDFSVAFFDRWMKGAFWTDLREVLTDDGGVKLIIHAMAGMSCCPEFRWMR